MKRICWVLVIMLILMIPRTPDPTLQQAQSQWWITALIGFAIIAIIVSGVVVSKFAREMRMR